MDPDRKDRQNPDRADPETREEAGIHRPREAPGPEEAQRPTDAKPRADVESEDADEQPASEPRR